MIQFIGHSWTIEFKNGYTYITDAVSASTVSLDDPAHHKPNEQNWIRVPEYVLKKARAMQRKGKKV